MMWVNNDADAARAPDAAAAGLCEIAD